METILKLPLGNHAFPEIIDSNLLCADKTKYIYKFIKPEIRIFFQSRPRRFGKTLLLHTINEFFTDNRERFEGLWIRHSDYAFPKLPVIFLSVSQDSESLETLKNGILNDLKANADEANLSVKGQSPVTYFGNLIVALYKSFYSGVTVLIGKYDAPVTRNMKNTALAQANADILHAFFSTLKKTKISPCLGFTLAAGISSPVLTSMDTGPNHLNDISLDPQFAGICGFTMETQD
ncbi:MAG: AAA family ATPase [Deltaproteobacteria bacterium]|jgi:hypothetical protein|nr:AAA family ATPase [Deltaproteobacteria bacterium]